MKTPTPTHSSHPDVTFICQHRPGNAIFLFTLGVAFLVGIPFISIQPLLGKIAVQLLLCSLGTLLLYILYSLQRLGQQTIKLTAKHIIVPKRTGRIGKIEKPLPTITIAYSDIREVTCSIAVIRLSPYSPVYGVFEIVHTNGTWSIADNLIPRKDLSELFLCLKPRIPHARANHLVEGDMAFAHLYEKHNYYKYK